MQFFNFLYRSIQIDDINIDVHIDKYKTVLDLKFKIFIQGVSFQHQTTEGDRLEQKSVVTW